MTATDANTRGGAQPPRPPAYDHTETASEESAPAALWRLARDHEDPEFTMRGILRLHREALKSYPFLYRPASGAVARDRVPACVAHSVVSLADDRADEVLLTATPLSPATLYRAGLYTGNTAARQALCDVLAPLLASANGAGGSIVLLRPDSPVGAGALISPSAKYEGIQLTYFDLDGFSRDTPKATPGEALREAAEDGYLIVSDRALLDELARTPRFAAGVERSFNLHRPPRPGDAGVRPRDREQLAEEFVRLTASDPATDRLIRPLKKHEAIIAVARAVRASVEAFLTDIDNPTIVAEYNEMTRVQYSDFCVQVATRVVEEKIERLCAAADAQTSARAAAAGSALDTDFVFYRIPFYKGVPHVYFHEEAALAFGLATRLLHLHLTQPIPDTPLVPRGQHDPAGGDLEKLRLLRDRLLEAARTFGFTHDGEDGPPRDITPHEAFAFNGRVYQLTDDDREADSVHALDLSGAYPIGRLWQSRASFERETGLRLAAHEHAEGGPQTTPPKEEEPQ
jgi:hypothetical protein